MTKKASSPYDAFDFTKFVDLGKVEFPDFTRMAEQFKVPGLDGTALLESQRKNVEALSQANRVAFEGAQALAHRQTEIFRQAMDEATQAMRELSSPDSPQDKVAKQTELFQEAVETALANMRELAEMMSKSNTEAIEVLNKRFSESLQELRQAIKASAAGK